MMDRAVVSLLEARCLAMSTESEDIEHEGGVRIQVEPSIPNPYLYGYEGEDHYETVVKESEPVLSGPLIEQRVTRSFTSLATIERPRVPTPSFYGIRTNSRHDQPCKNVCVDWPKDATRVGYWRVAIQVSEWFSVSGGNMHCTRLTS